MKLSSVYSPTDTKRSEKETEFSQRSIEDKVVEGKTTRQIRSFDDINNDLETAESLSAASSATLLVRKEDSTGKNLKYLGVDEVLDNPDSTMNTGLSSIEKRKSNIGNRNYFSLFGFGSAGSKPQYHTLSNGLSVDVVSRVIDEDDFRRIEYTKLSVEYPIGDVQVTARNKVGSIEGPSLQAKGANGNQVGVPQGNYSLNAFETDTNDLNAE